MAAKQQETPLSHRVCTSHQSLKRAPTTSVSSLEILDFLSASSVTGGHVRAASLRTVGARTRPGDLRNSKQSKSVCQRRKLEGCISLWPGQPHVKAQAR